MATMSPQVEDVMKRKIHKSHSLPNISENELLEIKRITEEVVSRKHRRRVSIATVELPSRLTDRRGSDQQHTGRLSKRRGSDLSIGMKRRVSRASLQCTTVAPEGGYGWVVVVCAFLTLSVSTGFSACFPVYYVEFLETFGQSKSKTAWIGSIMKGVGHMSAPFASACSTKYGVRTVGITTSLMSCIALILSSFCTDVEMLMVVLGLFGGFATGSLYMVAVMPIAFYFDKRQSLAMGIATCGGGAGFMFFPPLTEWLIDMYGWRGALLISSGLLLNGLVFCSLMRPLNDEKSKSLGRPMDEFGTTFQKGQRPSDIVLLSETESSSESIKILCMTKCSVSQTDLSVGLEHMSTRDKESRNGQDKTASLQQEWSNNCLNDSEMKPDTILGTGDHILGQDYYYNYSAHNDQGRRTKGGASKKWNKLLDNIDISFLWNPVFVYFVILQSAAQAGFWISLTFLMDYGISLGASASFSSLLFTTLGCTSMLSRIVIGRLTDQPSIDPFWVHGFISILAGILTLICGIMKERIVLICDVVALGIMQGSLSVLSPVLAVDLVGVDHMSSALGLSICISGFFILPFVPIAGWLFDITQTYTASFAFSAALFGLSGFIDFSLRCVARCLTKTPQDEP